MDTTPAAVLVSAGVTSEEQEAAADLVGVPESRAGILTLLDYASLMRGLELLPQRRVDVLAHFELDDEEGQQEIDRWNTWLTTHPSDAEECSSMAERMTDYWRRWDKSTPAAPTTTADQEPPPDPDNAPLELMAKLSGGLETLPGRRLEVFGALGAHTHDEHVDLQIALDRLVAGPDLDVKKFLALRAEAVPFWQRWLSPPTLSLVDYARLVLDLERAAPKDTPAIHRAHRLDRVSADRELSLWKKRLADTPGEAARYAEVREQLIRTANAPKRGAEPPAVGEAVREPAGGRAPMTARAVANPIFTRTPVVVQAIATAPTMPFVSPPTLAPDPVATPRTGFQATYARAPAAAPAPPSVVVAPVPASEPPPIGLLEYTVLCLQLELDEARAELHYRRLGLMNQAHRDQTHAYWQSRFEVDPSARKEWIDQAKRLRANWQGSRK